MTHANPSSIGPVERLREVARAARALIAGTLAASRHGLRPAGADLSLSNGGRNDGPPDLDELWRDFNRKLSGLFGGKGGNRNDDRPPGGPFQPDVKSAGIGAGLIGVVGGIVHAVGVTTAIPFGPFLCTKIGPQQAVIRLVP